MVKKYLQVFKLLYVVMFILIVSSGQILEDIADNYTDSENDYSGFKMGYLPKEDRLRCDALFKIEASNNKNRFIHLLFDRFKNPDSTDTLKISFTKLGLSLFSSDSILECFSHQETEFMKDNPVSIIKKLKSIYPSHTIISNSEISNIIHFSNFVYYKAVNQRYKSNVLSEQLEKIQNRIDLSRSLSLISFYTLIIILFLIIINHVEAINSLISREKKRTIQNDERVKFRDLYPELISHKFLYQLSLVALFSAFLNIGSFKSYRISENNFNERVYGLYSEHLKEYSLSNNCTGLTLSERDSVRTFEIMVKWKDQ